MNVTLRQAAQTVSKSTGGTDAEVRDQGRKVKTLYGNEQWLERQR